MPEPRPADSLEAELKWLYSVLETRLRLHFGQPSPVTAISQLQVPSLDQSDDPYSRLIRSNHFEVRERLVLALALAPYLRPALLDPLFTRNSTYDRPFTEFGGAQSAHGGQGGFVPTIETALFLLAGESLSERLECARLFAPDHPFQRQNLLDLGLSDPAATPGHRALRPSPPVLHHLTTGEVWRPRFGLNFPARRLTTCMEWSDLVLNHETSEQVREILDWIKHGDTLLKDWDLGRKLKRGLRSLFVGPPGTGKTLTATLLGKITERDVFRIDLSMLVSKYIGETEKNLENVFSQAEDRDWILFFDEADALFGRRTQVRDSHDRFANQEVSYLLQRVEDFPGVVVLATNLKDNLDDAFMRRFESVVTFPLPGPDEIQALWQKGFSARCPLAADIDLRRLSHRYRLSGGSIMNVVRFCSLRAVQREAPTIRLRDIEEGIRREFHKEGKTL
jgi:hypothetical protein